MLKKELEIYTFGDLLQHYPIRHIDKTKISTIAEINYQTDYIQIAGKLIQFDIIGEKRSKRLVAQLRDKTGTIELTWFQGISWIQKSLYIGNEYLVFGKTGFFNGKPQMVHPEIESFIPAKVDGKTFLEPVYPSTEKLKAKSLNGRQLAKLTYALLEQLKPTDLPENIPLSIVKELKLLGRYESFINIHFPSTEQHYKKALERLKFEEFFIAQVRLQLVRLQRNAQSRGVVFEKVGSYFKEFYDHYLPFALTGAQKRVIKEIRHETGRGKQMNRLLQGDVGSGKTMVALLSMLLAADHGYQSALMAPTEILAQQHYQGLTQLLNKMPVEVALLTGSTKSAERKRILAGLLNDEIHLVVGTHAIIEDKVQFKNLGLVIVDEQHRFGVAQRAKLWTKSVIPPHVLVMTATPIPTAAMTVYGDLDVSVLDELPPGRTPILTEWINGDLDVHRMWADVRERIAVGDQVYVVCPLIDESEKLEVASAQETFDDLSASVFPDSRVGLLHGRMSSVDKEAMMNKFRVGEIDVLVSSTVIEVGVDVPNATVMVVLDADRFGIAQLHQLRGRVGRGAKASRCYLVTNGEEMSPRVDALVRSTDGFELAEIDLALRGEGTIMSSAQKGRSDLHLASLQRDLDLIQKAREAAVEIIESDPTLDDHQLLRDELDLLFSQEDEDFLFKS